MGGFNGSGTFVRSYNWATDKANGIDITASRFDTEDNGFATGLSNCITRDGQGVPTAPISWNSQPLNNVSYLALLNDPASALQAATKRYVDNNIQLTPQQWGGTAGGTANAITVTLIPVPSAYSAGMTIAFIASAANTGAATLNVNSLGAVNLVRNDGVSLSANDILTGALCIARYDGVAGVFKLESMTSSQAATAAAIGLGLFESSTASGGSANAQTVAATGFTLTAGYAVIFNPGFTNTGALTLNVNGTAAKNVYVQTASGPAACVGGEVVSGQYAICVWDGTQFELINPAPRPGFGTLTNLASAATADLGTIFSHLVNITGTTTITSFGSSANLASPVYLVTFAGALTLTYNAASLILPGAASITTAAGDWAIMEYLGSGNWRCLDYIPASGQPAVAVAGSSMATGKILIASGSLSGSSLDISVPSDAQELEIEILGAGTGAATTYQLQYKVGGTAVSSGYAYSNIQNSGTTVAGASSGSAGNIPLEVANANSGTLYSTIKIQGVQNGNGKGFFVSSNYGNTSNQANMICAGQNASNTGLISDIVISPGSGSFSTGTYRVYKIK